MAGLIQFEHCGRHWSLVKAEDKSRLIEKLSEINSIDKENRILTGEELQEIEKQLQESKEAEERATEMKRESEELAKELSEKKESLINSWNLRRMTELEQLAQHRMQQALDLRQSLAKKNPSRVADPGGPMPNAVYDKDTIYSLNPNKIYEDPKFWTKSPAERHYLESLSMEDQAKEGFGPYKATHVEALEMLASTIKTGNLPTPSAKTSRLADKIKTPQKILPTELAERLRSGVPDEPPPPPPPPADPVDHYKGFELGEPKFVLERLSGFKCVNTDTIDGFKGNPIGLMSGTVVTVLPPIDDNPTSETMIKMGERSKLERQHALSDLLSQAISQGANGIVGLKYDMRQLTPNRVEIMAMGTAVQLEALPEPPPPPPPAPTPTIDPIIEVIKASPNLRSILTPREGTRLPTAPFPDPMGINPAMMDSPAMAEFRRLHPSQFNSPMNPEERALYELAREGDALNPALQPNWSRSRAGYSTGFNTNHAIPNFPGYAPQYGNPYTRGQYGEEPIPSLSRPPSGANTRPVTVASPRSAGSVPVPPGMSPRKTRRTPSLREAEENYRKAKEQQQQQLYNMPPSAEEPYMSEYGDMYDGQVPMWGKQPSPNMPQSMPPNMPPHMHPAYMGRYPPPRTSRPGSRQSMGGQPHPQWPGYHPPPQHPYRPHSSSQHPPYMANIPGSFDPEYEMGMEGEPIFERPKTHTKPPTNGPAQEVHDAGDFEDMLREQAQEAQQASPQTKSKSKKKQQKSEELSSSDESSSPAEFTSSSSEGSEEAKPIGKSQKITPYERRLIEEALEKERRRKLHKANAADLRNVPKLGKTAQNDLSDALKENAFRKVQEQEVEHLRRERERREAEAERREAERIKQIDIIRQLEMENAIKEELRKSEETQKEEEKLKRAARMLEEEQEAQKAQERKEKEDREKEEKKKNGGGGFLSGLFGRTTTTPEKTENPLLEKEEPATLPSLHDEFKTGDFNIGKRKKAPEIDPYISGGWDDLNTNTNSSLLTDSPKLPTADPDPLDSWGTFKEDTKTTQSKPEPKEDIFAFKPPKMESEKPSTATRPTSGARPSSAPKATPKRTAPTLETVTAAANAIKAHPELIAPIVPPKEAPKKEEPKPPVKPTPAPGKSNKKKGKR